jgi:hypothetical protein
LQLLASDYKIENPYKFFLFAFSLLSGTIAIVYLLQPGIFRFFGVVLLLITGWLGYTALMRDTSNHSVKVSPTGVVREVGTIKEPIRHEIQFAQTDYLFIDEIKENRGSRYELVAYARADGTEKHGCPFSI